MHEEVVLGEEAGEEHSVPLLVGALDDEGTEARFEASTPELAGFRPEPVAVPALVGGEARIWFLLTHREGLDRGLGGTLRGVAGGYYDILQVPAEGCNG